MEKTFKFDFFEIGARTVSADGWIRSCELEILLTTPSLELNVLASITISTAVLYWLSEYFYTPFSGLLKN